MLIIATHNAHKMEEIQEILKNDPIQITSLAQFEEIPEPEEPFQTFQQNAAAKAQAIWEYTGGIVMADDSGLEVEALHGAPGVQSKRYTPEATAQSNNSKLLSEMQNQSNRKAQFRCVLAFYDGQNWKFIEGICKGSIGETLKGDAGFGYDPLFISECYPDRSMAELSMQEKNQISHRGLALQQLQKILETQSLQEWLQDSI